MRARWLVLVLASCAPPDAPRDTLRARLPAGELAQAFPACGLASVVARSDDDYAVSACYQRAIYHCDAAECALRSIGVAPLPAREPPPPPAPDGTPTPAQLVEADRLFEDGRKLAKDQRLDDACQRFARSDAIKRTFGTAVNLGDCADRDGHPGAASALYDEAGALAQRTGNAAQLKFARDRGAAVAPKLCTLVLTIDDADADGLAILVDERELPAAAEIRTLVAPGTLEVSVSAPGVYVRRWRVTGAAGGVIELHVPALPR